MAVCIATMLTACTEDTIQPDIFGTLTGQVLLEGTNTPLADAVVSTNPATTQVVTDAQGRFSFDEIEAGTYTVRAEKSGYVAAVETATILENRESAVIINMTVKEAENTPPSTPENIAPANGTTDLDISITLQWSASDVDEDALSFDVYTFHSMQGPANLVIRIIEERGENLGLAREQTALVGGELIPVLDGLRLLGKTGSRRNDARRELTRERLLAELVPAHVELALPLLDPILRHVMGRVRRSRCLVAASRSTSHTG